MYSSNMYIFINFNICSLCSVLAFIWVPLSLILLWAGSVSTYVTLTDLILLPSLSTATSPLGSTIILSGLPNKSRHKLLGSEPGLPLENKLKMAVLISLTCTSHVLSIISRVFLSVRGLWIWETGPKIIFLIHPSLFASLVVWLECSTNGPRNRLEFPGLVQKRRTPQPIAGTVQEAGFSVLSGQNHWTVSGNTEWHDGKAEDTWYVRLRPLLYLDSRCQLLRCSEEGKQADRKFISDRYDVISELESSQALLMDQSGNRGGSWENHLTAGGRLMMSPRLLPPLGWDRRWKGRAAPEGTS